MRFDPEQFRFIALHCVLKLVQAVNELVLFEIGREVGRNVRDGRATLQFD